MSPGFRVGFACTSCTFVRGCIWSFWSFGDAGWRECGGENLWCGRKVVWVVSCRGEFVVLGHGGRGNILGMGGWGLRGVVVVYVLSEAQDEAGVCVLVGEVVQTSIAAGLRGMDSPVLGGKVVNTAVAVGVEGRRWRDYMAVV